MAGMFYSLQEVAAKLGKTEEEVKDIIKQGRLREFRDGPNLLFKVDEVEALMSDTSMAASRKTSAKEQPAEEDEISLAPEPIEEQAEVGSDTTATASEGVDTLSEADEDYKLADDTLGETKIVPDRGALGEDTLSETKATSGEASLEEIEEDVNLDTFGSGSGLLDLSLQADDTSLGGILDEIYTPEGEEEKTPEGGAEASAVEVAAEAEQLMPDEELTASESGPGAAVMVQTYTEPAPDMMSNALGIMLILPLLAVIYTAIVAVASFNNTMPSALTPIQGLIWYIVIGAIIASGLMIGIAFMLGGKGKGGKTAVKKKKAKKTKETPPPEAESEGEST